MKNLSFQKTKIIKSQINKMRNNSKIRFLKIKTVTIVTLYNKMTKK
jgi:hypothetical protein